MFIKHITLYTLMLLMLYACSGEKEKKSITENGMKCGAGKCGASMVDGSALLVKKKMNILNQLKDDDRRRDCVLKATTTKALYHCVRNKETGRLSTKCASNEKEKSSSMKCETGKCGN